MPETDQIPSVTAVRATLLTWQCGVAHGPAHDTKSAGHPPGYCVASGTPSNESRMAWSVRALVSGDLQPMFTSVVDDAVDRFHDRAARRTSGVHHVDGSVADDNTVP